VTYLMSFVFDIQYTVCLQDVGHVGVVSIA